jgi:hypothetical protein
MGVFRRKRGVEGLNVARCGEKGKRGEPLAKMGTKYTLGLQWTAWLRETMGPRKPRDLALHRREAGNPSSLIWTASISNPAAGT